LSTVAALVARLHVVFQLEARQLQHEYVGQDPVSAMLSSSSSTASPMFPATVGRKAGGTAQRARERSDGCLAVRPGDCQHLLVRRQRARKELDVAHQLDPARFCLRDCGSAAVDAGTDRDQVDIIEMRAREWTRQQGRIGQRLRQSRSKRRRRSRVGYAHPRPLRRQMASEREAGLSQPQHDRIAPRVSHRAHRSFNEDRPNSTSSMVMIQKRTTTWFSFQPLSS
jgi:hypothetical protein